MGNEKLKVTDKEFDTVVLKSKKPVLVDFWAEWCGPCHMLSPILEEVAKENDAIIIKKLNVDENQQTAMKYQIMSLPTVALFKDGEIVESLIGVQPKGAYEEIIKKHT